MGTNMLRKLLVIIAISMSSYGISAAAREFTEADWAGVPAPGELSVEEVMGLFVGPIEKGGREWTLASLNNAELTAVIADRQFEVRQLTDGDVFLRQQFTVDSAGMLRRELFLVSLTKTYPREEGDEDEEFYLNAHLPILTQLKAAELANPIVRAIQSPLTFEEESRLARENMGEYQRTIGLRNARNLLIFLHPDRMEEARAELEAELGTE